jgi:hypothetical protein
MSNIDKMKVILQRIMYVIKTNQYPYFPPQVLIWLRIYDEVMHRDNVDSLVSYDDDDEDDERYEDYQDESDLEGFIDDDEVETSSRKSKSRQETNKSKRTRTSIKHTGTHSTTTHSTRLPNRNKFKKAVIYDIQYMTALSRPLKRRTINRTIPHIDHNTPLTTQYIENIGKFEPFHTRLLTLWLVYFLKINLHNVFSALENATSITYSYLMFLSGNNDFIELNIPSFGLFANVNQDGKLNEQAGFDNAQIFDRTKSIYLAKKDVAAFGNVEGQV